MSAPTIHAEPGEVIRAEHRPLEREQGSRWRTRDNLERLLSALSPIVLLVIWEGAVALGRVDTRFFPAPSGIFAETGKMLQNGELWTHVSISLQRIAIGFAI